MINFQWLQIRTDSITQKFTNQAYSWIVNFGPKILIAVAAFFLGQWIIKILDRGLRRVLSNKRFDATLRPFVHNVLQIALQVLLVLGIMQILGIQMTLFAAVLGAAGVAVGLALSGTLQNFAGGFLIIILKPFRIGDNIRTQNEEGTVTAIKLFYTVIRTFNNSTLIVPNSKLSNEVIFNLTLEKKRRMDLTIKLDNEVEFEKVKRVIMKTIETFEGCLKDPPPRVGVDRIEMDCYTIIINAWINSHGFYDTRFQFNEKLFNSLKPLLSKDQQEEIKKTDSTKNTDSNKNSITKPSTTSQKN